MNHDQEWCLRCGAAARTRLAASPNWKAPTIALAVVAALALAVIAVALVKLAGTSGSSATGAATTAAGPASVTSPGTATPSSVPSATAPSATAPGGSTPVAVAAVGLVPVSALTSTAVTLNGTVNPQGVPTTYQFHYGTTASYGALAPGKPLSVGVGTAAVAVSARVAYLAPGTTYHYKLTASKAGRAISSADATFTTPPAHSAPSAGGTAPAKNGVSR